MIFHIITIFPEIFDSYFRASIIGRAQTKGAVKIKIHDLRQWTDDRHRTVDDAPYGGGAGMMMKVEPIYKALQAVKSEIRSRGLGTKSETNSNSRNNKLKTILFSARGKRWDQRLAQKYSRLESIILVCGRYEGVDERVKKFVDEEISIGDYVLTGGEVPAMVIVDAVTRLLPGVLGNADSARLESHSTPGIIEYPQYTRPDVFTAAHKKYRVPKILLSGNHAEIEQWRRKKMKKVKSR